MTVKDLKEYLNNFKDDAIVEIWEWNNPNSGDNFAECCIGCNYEYQQENQLVQLYRGLPKARPLT